MTAKRSATTSSNTARGARIAVSGVALLIAACGNAFDVSAFERGHAEPQFEQEPVGEGVQPLVNAPPRRTRTAAALQFDLGLGPPTAATLAKLLGPNGQIPQMYNEISFGMQDLTVDLKGPFTLPVADCLTIACCGPSSDKTGNGATVQGYINGFDKKYDHYFWVYGPQPASATCSTWGDEGSPMMPAVYSSYNFLGLVGNSQEVGHNFGMTHEPTLISCTGTNKIFPDNPGECTHNEYGSKLSFMGMGGGHPSAYHKVQQGWMSGCNGVKVGGSGTFTLLPQELACNGVQILQVPMPKSRPGPAQGDRQNMGTIMLTDYYVEMRGPYGFDNSLFRSAMQPMVVISAGPDLPSSTKAAPYVYVLNQTPATTDMSKAGLMTVGQQFADPAGGVTITLMAIDAKSATVSVTMTATGSSTCLDNTAFTGPGAGPESCGGLATLDGGVLEASSGSSGDGGAGGGSGGGADGSVADASGGSSGGGGADSSAGRTSEAGGTGGSSGSAGTDGSTATTGTDGSAATSGDSGSAGQAGDFTLPTSHAGCGCSVPKSSPAAERLGPWMLLAGAGLLRGRSPRGRRRSPPDPVD